VKDTTELPETEDDVETKEAFDALLIQLKDALKNKQEQAMQAIQQGQFANAQTAAKGGEDLSTYIQYLERLQQNWTKLILGKQPILDKKSKRRRLPHLSPGRKTPQQAYRIPILQALKEMGGRGRPRDVLLRIEEKMKPSFNELDLGLLHDGHTHRWKNAAGWERQNMIKTGLLSPDMPVGIWEITEEGRNYLKEYQEKKAN
jgi:hypothetical protein